MTVKFTTVERPNPRDPAAPKKHYPQVQSRGKVTRRKVRQGVA